MTYPNRLVTAAACSIAGHLLFAAGALGRPQAREVPPMGTLEVKVIEPPPPVVEEEPPAEPVEPVQRKTVRPAPPDPRPPSRARVAAHETETPPGDRPNATATDSPVYGVSMDSSSQGGMAVPKGTSLQGAADGNGLPSRGNPDSASTPVAAYEVTRMPAPEGRCSGRYTEEAREAGIEGTVVLDVVVGADGRTRDIKVVQGLSHGLDEAAVTALAACHFSPGEREGRPVAVRIRTFKITFFMQGQ